MLLGPEKSELFFAGLAGSVVSATVEWQGWPSTLRKILVGTLCAMFLSPLSTPLLVWLLVTIKVPEGNAPGMSGFLMGVLGIVFIEYLVITFRVKLKKGGRDGDPSSD